MKASEILAEEALYHARWTKSGEARKGSIGGLDLFDYRPATGTDYYFDEAPRKSMVVLHYTMGWLWGDIATLTTAHLHVSVAFLVARSGRIYRLFPEDRWAYHLGKRKDVTGDTELLSKRSIAIELSNVGPLDLAGDTLKFVGRPYCDVSETAFYTKLTSPYRGFRYFAAFSDAQYAALDALLEAITATYAIPRKFVAPQKRFLTFDSPAAADAYKGVSSHVNFRRTGKTDIGPAFDWPRIRG